MKVGMSIMRVAAVLVLSGLPTLGEAHNAVDDGGFVNEASAAEGQALIEASALEALAPGISSRGGLCVLIGGVDNVDLIKALVAEGSWTIHGLDSRHEVIEQMRGRLQDLGLYGRVTVEYWNAEELPYADNLVNVIITSDRKALPGREEIQRVLAPEGVAFAPEGERIVRFVKPRPEELGDWTHPWQDASGNPVSSDLVFEVPNTFQWVAGPLFPFSARKGSTHVILNSGGRTFYVTENVPMNRPLLQSEHPSTRKPPYLVARDSFNGTLLWSQPWDGPSGPGFSAPHEAIVVSSERVYVSRNPGHVAVLDANTGQTQAIWDTEGDVPRRLLLQDDVLVAQGREGLTAFDISDGTRLWLHQAEAPWSALVNEGRLFFLGSSREVSGEWKHDLYAVEMGGGEVLWQQPVESKYGHRNTAELRLMFAGAGVLVMIERTELRVMSAKDGAELWRHETEAQSRPIQGIDSRQAGHFLIDDAIWIRDRSQWTAHDPLTGEKLREVPGPGAGPNRACQMLTATRRFGVESRYSRLWSFTGEGGIAGEFMFARGGCMHGIMPANGMGYIPPNACGCAAQGQQLHGYMAIGRTDDAGLRSSDPGPLETGPAFGMIEERGEGDPNTAWPAYRRDGMRSAFLPAKVPAEGLEVLWRAVIAPNASDFHGEWELAFGRRLTPPVISDGRVVMAVPQTHQVIALGEADGRELWRFTAGGRISTPPSIVDGIALFGSHDGFVYALRASDGELLWRLRAAPSKRRMMAYGQLESAWPVKNVLVHGGVAFAAAGRAIDADGGAVVHAIDPHTGAVIWSSRVKDALHGKPDLLVSDGSAVYLMNRRLDVQSGEVEEIAYGIQMVVRMWNGARVPRVSYPDGIRYLRSGLTGFSSSAWTQHVNPIRMMQSTWTWGESEGELIAFDREKGAGFSFQVDVGANMRRNPSRVSGGRIESRFSGSDVSEWLFEVAAPAQVEAMVLTRDLLFIAGPDDRAEPDGSGFMRAIDRSDGSLVAHMALHAAPVFDGLAAANGKVFAVLKDGSALCMQGR